jgi:hypothetical protein
VNLRFKKQWFKLLVWGLFKNYQKVKFAKANVEHGYLERFVMLNSRLTKTPF